MANTNQGKPPVGKPVPIQNLGEVLRVATLILIYFSAAGANQAIHQFAAAHPATSGLWHFVILGWQTDTSDGLFRAFGFLLACLGIPSAWKIVGPFILDSWKNTGEFFINVARAVRGKDIQPKPDPAPAPGPVTPPKPTRTENLLHALKVALIVVVYYAAFGLNRGAHEFAATLHPAGWKALLKLAVEVNLSQGALISFAWLLSCWAGPDLWKIIGPLLNAAAQQTTEFAKNIGRAFRRQGNHLDEPGPGSAPILTLANVLQALQVAFIVVLYFSANGINKGVHAWAATVHPHCLCQFLGLDLKVDSSQGAFAAFVWLLTLWAGPSLWRIVGPIVNATSAMTAQLIGKFARAVRIPSPGEQDSSN